MTLTPFATVCSFSPCWRQAADRGVMNLIMLVSDTVSMVIFGSKMIMNMAAQISSTHHYNHVTQMCRSLKESCIAM